MNNIIKRTWNQNRMVEIEDLTGSAFQSESGGHTFEISGVDDSGASVSLSGTVEGRFLRPDNALVTITGTASGGKVSVTLTSTCYAVNGRFSLTIFVTSGGQKTAVYSCVGIISVASGTAGGSVPPLVTDSIQTETITASGDVTISGVLDLTQRRANASLSGNSWYRVLKYTGANDEYDYLGDYGRIFDINITRKYTNGNNEAHRVRLLNPYNVFKFVDENSCANGLFIDKIRCMANSSTKEFFVDIHYNTSNSNPVTVDFAMYSNPITQSRCVSAGLIAVDDAPSGETMLTTYTFAANTITDISSSFTLNTTGISGLSGKVHALYDASSQIVHLNFAAYTTSTTFGTGTAILTCSNADYRPKNSPGYGNGMVRGDSGEWNPYEVYISTSGSVYQALTSTANRVYGQITYQV